jgi:hypothetical protein
MKDSKFNEIRSSLDESSDDYEMSGSSSSSKKSKSETPVLDAYSRDLTKLAEDDVLDPIIGREKEINRVCQILARRKKNNPILLGEPGCVDAETIITVRKKYNNNTHNIVNTYKSIIYNKYINKTKFILWKRKRRKYQLRIE